MKNIICYGELLIDFYGSIKDGFIPKFGGAPVNTAAGLSKLGHDNIYFVGKIGKDFFGDFLKKKVDEYNINSDYLFRTEEKNTTLAFVSLDEKGQRDFSFVRGAHEIISKEDIKDIDFSDSLIFHFGSLTQVNDICFSATKELIQKAKDNNLIISYDPNVREPLWDDLNRLKEIILETSKKVNLFKISSEELEFLTGTTGVENGAKELFNDNLDLLIITLGEKGAFYMTKDCSGFVETMEYNVVDTTGAGDAFNAGFLFKLKDYIVDGKIEITEEEIKKSVEFANKVAGITTEKRGAADSIPKAEEL